MGKFPCYFAEKLWLCQIFVSPVMNGLWSWNLDTLPCWRGVYRALPTSVGDVIVSAHMTFKNLHIWSYGWATVMKLFFLTPCFLPSYYHLKLLHQLSQTLYFLYWWTISGQHLVTPYIHILRYCIIKSDKITRIFFPPMHISFHRQGHLFRAINSQSD